LAWPLLEHYEVVARRLELLWVEVKREAFDLDSRRSSAWGRGPACANRELATATEARVAAFREFDAAASQPRCTDEHAAGIDVIAQFNFDLHHRHNTACTDGLHAELCNHGYHRRFPALSDLSFGAGGAGRSPMVFA
jgi:hypothetical protein